MTDPELFAAIVDQAPDAIILADRDGRIRLWNHGAEQLFGHVAAEALGRVQARSREMAERPVGRDRDE